MSTNKKGDKLYSLVRGWNRAVTMTEAMAREAKSSVVKTRQVLRAKLTEMTRNAVNREDDKRCSGRFAPVRQTRKERRALARAYFKAAWLKRAAVVSK